AGAVVREVPAQLLAPDARPDRPGQGAVSGRRADRLAAEGGGDPASGDQDRDDLIPVRSASRTGRGPMPGLRPRPRTRARSARSATRAHPTGSTWVWSRPPLAGRKPM